MTWQPLDDGYVIPEVGVWAKRKYHFVGRYLDAFTKAMRKKWPELHYIDLFAGAGVARIRDSSELVASSTLLACTRSHPFTQIHACDRDKENVTALRHRLGLFQHAKLPRVLHGDANVVVRDLLAGIPRTNALCVTLADPFGLHLDFDTIKAVSALKTDLIVLIADNMDAMRNWAKYYYDNPNSSLDRFMGEPGWRSILSSVPAERGAERLRKRYMEKLKDDCGFQYFDQILVQNSNDRDIYSLLFASRAKEALTIWDGISAIDEGGQRDLPFLG